MKRILVVLAIVFGCATTAQPLMPVVLPSGAEPWTPPSYAAVYHRLAWCLGTTPQRQYDELSWYLVPGEHFTLPLGFVCRVPCLGLHWDGHIFVAEAARNDTIIIRHELAHALGAPHGADLDRCAVENPW